MKDGIGGPFLAVALFCERVLQEKDGVLSAIRIIDRFIHTVVGEDVPDKMPSFKVQMSILIGFKSGDAKGKSELRIKPNTPSGKALPVFSVPILLEGADKGANVNIGYAFEATEEGLYWFDVMLNDKLFTRMPLSIIYQKTQTITAVH
ncbi:MAG: hypothetical protein ACLP2P_02310 [Desulfobaccales bacterium]